MLFPTSVLARVSVVHGLTTYVLRSSFKRVYVTGVSGPAAFSFPSAWPPHPACNFLKGFKVARKCLLLCCLIVTLKVGVKGVVSELMRYPLLGARGTTPA